MSLLQMFIKNGKKEYYTNLIKYDFPVPHCPVMMKLCPVSANTFAVSIISPFVDISQVIFRKEDGVDYSRTPTSRDLILEYSLRYVIM